MKPGRDGAGCRGLERLRRLQRSERDDQPDPVSEGEVEKREEHIFHFAAGRISEGWAVRKWERRLTGRARSSGLERSCCGNVGIVCR
jgi:hypothetical protein